MKAKVNARMGERELGNKLKTAGGEKREKRKKRGPPNKPDAQDDKNLSIIVLQPTSKHQVSG